MVTGTVSAIRQSMEKAIADQDKSKMPDQAKSAEDSAVSGLEPKTEINLIRGFKATKRVIPRASENGVHILHLGSASMHLLSLPVRSYRHAPVPTLTASNAG